VPAAPASSDAAHHGRPWSWQIAAGAGIVLLAAVKVYVETDVVCVDPAPDAVARLNVSCWAFVS
jgi:hypothetical protein